jgi:hypothetical protein
MHAKQEGIGFAPHLRVNKIDIHLAFTPPNIVGGGQTVIIFREGIMYQRFMPLILFLYAVISATSALGANAARFAGDHQAHMVSIESRQFPLTEGGSESSASAIGDRSYTSSTALGYVMSPGILLGSTSYDLQHNMRMARQISVGADNRVHLVWTSTGLPYYAEDRAVIYTSYNPSTAILDEPMNVSNDMNKTPGRYCTVDNFANRALIVNHYGAGPNTTSALDIFSGGYSFMAVDCPSNVVNCQGIYANGANASTFQEYIWPDASADVGGTGQLVIHAIAAEGNTVGGAWSAIAYFRGISSGANMDAGMYGTCGMFVDSCTTTGYVIAADPYSDRVVIVYPKGRGGATRYNNDLAYRLSTDLGATWGPIVNVTNYHTSYKERCLGDMSVLFGADGFFHILYITAIYDSVEGTISDPVSKLWHWSSANPVSTGGLTPNFHRSLVLDANNSDNACYSPAFEWNIAKVTLTQCMATNLTPDDTVLYAVYSRQLGTTAAPDCSDLNYYNQEVFFSPSNTWGETWGAPVNLTNTNTNGCLAPNCADDGSSSTAKYVTDSIRVEYLEDHDAGSNVGNESGTASLLNPLKFISNVCIDMAPYKVLTCTPGSIDYPFHAVRNATTPQDLLLVNGGNGPITWNAVALNNGSPNAPVSVPGSGTVQAGLSNSATITATVGPCATEGLFRNTIRFSYDNGSKAITTLDVPIEFYVFDVWFLPQDIAIRTANNRLAVNQVSQAADNILGNSFTFFSNLTEDFINDGSLIMGNSASNLSWKIFARGQGNPTPSNNFGRIYAMSNTTADSTSFYPGSPFGYRIAQGRGTNRDTTVEFEVKWYAMRHVDSANYYIGHFDLYKGVKWTTNVTNLSIAYACDWDVPSDTGSDNTFILDKPRQAIILKGQYTESSPDFRQRGYAALAAWREDNVPITGGFGWGNQQQVYAQGGYHVDSVWKYMEAIAAPPNNYNSSWQDSVGDMSLVLAIAKDYTVTATSHLKFNVILAARRAQDNVAGLTGIQAALDMAKSSMCKYASPGQPLCLSCDDCGDANSNGHIDISDAIYLIAYIFACGAAPGDCGYAFGKGDANGDGMIRISDAVYLIAYIFASGSAPHCQGM